jgi:mannose-6-phosphate isomerase-like protein (cupin superfamily)
LEEWYQLQLFLAVMLWASESSSDPYDDPEEDDEMTRTATNPYHLASGDGLADVWWKTGRITLKAGAEETGGAFSQFEVDDPRGSGPPLHVHHTEDETFYVLEGEVTIVVGDERIDLAAGDFAFGPRGVPHAYLVRSERARMLVTISPSGSEQLFVSLGVPVTGAEPPTDTVMPPLPEMARLFAGYGAEILGPPLSLEEARAV